MNEATPFSFGFSYLEGIFVVCHIALVTVQLVVVVDNV